MNKKIDIAKITGSKWFGIGLAVAAAIGAFVTERQNQEKEKTIENLIDRVSKLENK